MASWALGLVWVCLLCPSLSFSWGGDSVCSMSDEDVKRLEHLCTESASQVNESVAALEQKLERILTFVEELRVHENAWIEEDIKTTVERDIPFLPTPEESRGSREDYTTTTTTSTTSTTTTTTPPPPPPPTKRGEWGREKEMSLPEKGECEARVIDNHETIGMFYMTSFRHGHCANRHPVPSPIRYCLGHCTTRTYIERESVMWAQRNDCRSCQVAQLETLSIQLLCDDGYTFSKRFDNVVACRCKRCEVKDTTEDM